jgi:hypothetical protein
VKKNNSKVNVVGHSLGNMVIGVAMQDYHMTVDHYIAVDAAVALEAYGSDYDVDHSMIKVANSGREWKSYFDYDNNNNSNQMKLLPSEWHTLFEGADDHRQELTWKNRLAGVVGDNVLNFYSSTEDVLATYDGDNLVWDESLLNFPDKAWVKQEKFKGRIVDLSSNIGGVASPYAGWGYNLSEPSYVVTTTVNDPKTGESTTLTFPKMPSELGQLDQSFIDGLKTKPFFTPNPPELFNDTSGSGFVVKKLYETKNLKNYYNDVDAGNILVRDWLLAEAFPATSLPMGANLNKKLNEVYNNFNMSTSDENGMMTSGTLCKWPRADNTWHHSDYKDLSLQHVNKFYMRIANLIN